MIESFTGKAISAQTILGNINHPRNAFNAQSDAHDKFDQLAWGIEAIAADGQVSTPTAVPLTPVI